MRQQSERQKTQVHTASPQGAEILPAEVLATLGHEFRGPLTTILGYTSTLLHHDQQLLPEERQDFLRAIHEAGRHLEKLVARFLDLADLEGETTALTPGPVDLFALAQEAITAGGTRQSHPLLLVPDFLERQPALHGEQQTEATREALVMVGDRRLLRTMLDVLLENAVAYSPPACPIEVHISPTDSTRLAALPGSHAGMYVALPFPAPAASHDSLLEIQVRDHGMGIAPEHLGQIFQRFYRGDSSLTREVNGLGLGLTLCKAIVAKHRGMLWVESTPGEGSSFHVVLPRGSPTEGKRESRDR